MEHVSINPAIDERVAQVDANGAVKYIHTDKQSSVIALSDTSGNVISRHNYGSYGETSTTQMTDAAAHPFGYTGRRWDADLGIYYYRARWYDPEVGTFLETDPIGAMDYINLYSYVGLDPMDLSDPSGMQTVFIGGGGEKDSRNLPGISYPIMSNFRDNYSAMHPERATMYFGHMQTNVAYEAILEYRERANENGNLDPLVIVGLSWGGSEAIKLADKLGTAGVQTDLLITLDPVGKASNLQVAGAMDSSSEWRNVSSDSAFSTIGSFAAAFWRRNEQAKIYSNNQISTHFDHEDVNAMMKALGDDGKSATQAIEDAYKHRDKRF